MMTSKINNSECCMCGDHGIPHELFRCKVCHYRSQHRYCSNLYPKAETYRVCNWCLIQKDDQDNHTTNTNSSINNNSSNSSSQENSTPKSTNRTTNNIKKFNSINHTTTSNGPRSPKCLQPNSPIKKPMRSPDSGSPSGRRRLISQEEKERLMLRRTKSSQEMSKNSINTNNKNYNNNNSFISSNRSNGGPSSGVGGSGGGPAVIKHVFRNKVVRRYKLLDEVSS